MKQFKIRCSSIGKIMTEPKKGMALSVGAMSYCDAWIKTQIFNDRRNLYQSPFIAKGNIMEDNSIDFIAERLGYGFLLKNEQYFEDKTKTGTPDIIPVGNDDIVDVKNSWDWQTFPLMADKLPEINYYWQGQGYLDLAKRGHFKVVYVLMDTPQHLIERAARSYCYNNGYEELDIDIYNEFERNMTYDDIPPEYRIKVFEFDKSKEDIQRIDYTVNECRKYIRNRIKELKIKL